MVTYEELVDGATYSFTRHEVVRTGVYVPSQQRREGAPEKPGRKGFVSIVCPRGKEDDGPLEGWNVQPEELTLVSLPEAEETV